MIGTHGLIEDDLYGITARLKEIDPAYFVVRNYRKKRFELHASGQKGGTLALVLPFDKLDARTLTLARKTRSERVHLLMRQAEQENARLAQAELGRLSGRVAEKLEG